MTRPDLTPSIRVLQSFIERARAGTVNRAFLGSALRIEIILGACASTRDNDENLLVDCLLHPSTYKNSIAQVHIDKATAETEHESYNHYIVYVEEMICNTTRTLQLQADSYTIRNEINQYFTICFRRVCFTLDNETREWPLTEKCIASVIRLSEQSLYLVLVAISILCA